MLLPAVEANMPSVGSASASAGTCYQGNSSCQTSGLPPKILWEWLPELSPQSGCRRACLWARWTPKLQNKEADAFTKGELHHSNPFHAFLSTGSSSSAWF